VLVPVCTAKGVAVYACSFLGYITQVLSENGTMEKMNVESFNLDHRAVTAPYVRIADRKILPGGDTLIKYDVRFTQPNTAHLDMPAVHSIEHLSAELMRNHTDKLIDFSPMGCQTGFYALTLGIEPQEFMPILEATMRDILEATEVRSAAGGHTILWVLLKRPPAVS